jgi:cation:H+ antiporter
MPTGSRIFFYRMQNLALIWIALLACLAVIGVAGVRLSRYGDIIAEKTGMSRG